MAHRRTHRRLAGVLTAALFALAAGCSRTDVLTSPPGSGGSSQLPALQTKSIAAPTLSTLHASSPTIASCAPATVYPLTDGKRTVGTVSVSNDATNIYVTYATPTKYWWISDTRLAVVKSASLVPTDGSGPSPWDFPLAGVHEPPITSFTYTVRLTDIGVAVGGTAYVSAMAGVVHPVVETDAGMDGDWEWLVMWGVGSTSSTATEVIHPYAVASCGGTVTPPPPPPPSSAGGVFTITFDDGFATTYNNAYPVLRDLGLKGNVAVNPTPIDEQWGDYMKFANLQVLWGAGWSIVSHTMDHQDLTTLSPTAMEAEIRDAKAWVAAKGFGPTSVFIVPFHSWGSRERTMIAKYHTYVRGHTIDEFSPEKFATWPVTQPLDINAFEPEFAPYKTEQGRALTMAKLKYAIDNGLYLDLMFHKIPTATLPQFKDLMTQIATAYKPNMRTWKDIAQ